MGKAGRGKRARKQTNCNSAAWCGQKLSGSGADCGPCCLPGTRFRAQGREEGVPVPVRGECNTEERRLKSQGKSRDEVAGTEEGCLEEKKLRSP